GAGDRALYLAGPADARRNGTTATSRAGVLGGDPAGALAGAGVGARSARRRGGARRAGGGLLQSPLSPAAGALPLSDAAGPGGLRRGRGLRARQRTLRGLRSDAGVPGASLALRLLVVPGDRPGVRCPALTPRPDAGTQRLEGSLRRRVPASPRRGEARRR